MASRPPAHAQDALFDGLERVPPGAPALPARPPRHGVAAADASAWRPLASRLGPLVHLGTSSWSFPGWRGLVWADAHDAPALSRHGLPAYAQHPLLRTVSVDRSFYRALDAAAYAAMAAQVPEDFRFVVKAPASITDASLRAHDSGRAERPNPLFLDPARAWDEFVQPAIGGLGERVGALVFQLSPLGGRWLRDPVALHKRLDALFAACAPASVTGAAIALEVRDTALLTPELAALLRRHGIRYCLGLHDRLPPIGAQLPMLRALWPGPLVCRWNLQRGLRYGQAKGRFAPFDRLQAPDPATRDELARIVAGTVAGGYAAYATINNKAEGSAPLSVIELARAIGARLDGDAGSPASAG